MCDSVLIQSDKIVSSSYRLEKYLTDKESCEILQFIEIVKANFPKFSAARFCFIERSTLYKIFETVSTVLIIMIQFNPDLNHNKTTEFNHSNQSDTLS